MTTIGSFQLPGIRDLTIANHIAHGGSVGGASLKFACENCGYDLFAIEEYEENLAAISRGLSLKAARENFSRKWFDSGRYNAMVDIFRTNAMRRTMPITWVIV